MLAAMDIFAPRRLRDDLFVLPHREEEVAARGIPANTYALQVGDSLILLDVVFNDALLSLRTFITARVYPAALVLTHRHVVAQEEVLTAVVKEFGIPVFLDPVEACHPQVTRVSKLAFEDPAKSALLAELGIDVLPMPGHTEGHIMLYRSEGNGLLLAGDCAVGPSAGEVERGSWPLVRPPLSFNIDDEQLRRGWERFSLPVTTLGRTTGFLSAMILNTSKLGFNLWRTRQQKTDFLDSNRTEDEAES